MGGGRVDGKDVRAVRAGVETAVARARGGDGPTLLECKTYRIRGHFEGDPQRYKPAEEQAYWKERDPVKRLREHLIGPVRMSAARLEEIDREVERVIREAVAFADAAALP